MWGRRGKTLEVSRRDCHKGLWRSNKKKRRDKVAIKDRDVLVALVVIDCLLKRAVDWKREGGGSGVTISNRTSGASLMALLKRGQVR